jgi:hypothetical protein
MLATIHSRTFSSCLLLKNVKIRIDKTVILYGSETWPLTLKEEYRLRVFENRLLRIFGLRRDEVTRGCRKLHNEQLRDLYSLPSIIRIFKSRRMRWTGHVTRMGGRGTHVSYF